MTPSKMCVYFCLSFILGIFLNSIIPIPRRLMPGFLVSGFILTSAPLLAGRKKTAIAGFCLIFSVLGIWRHQATEAGIRNYELKGYNDSEQNIILVGTIVKEPDARGKSVKLIVHPEGIDGKILATVNRYPEYEYGDKLKITGKLK